MDASTPRRDKQGLRMLSPVPSPIDETDVLKYINQRQAQRESVYIECSDPGVHEDQAMYHARRSNPRTVMGDPSAMAVGSPENSSTTTTGYKTHSAMRTGQEVRWQDLYSSASVMETPTANRRRQNQRMASQSVLSKRNMPETILESPPSSGRATRRAQQKSEDDLAGSAAGAAAIAAQAALAAAAAAAVAANAAEASIPKSVPPAAENSESPLQMFDRILRFELTRIKSSECDELGEFVEVESEVPECSELPGIREAAAQFARAQAACDFDAAVRAAEAAAADAPPEKAEEAAVTGAKEYRTEIVDEINEVFPGNRLVEITGYVGITRPVNPEHNNN